MKELRSLLYSAVRRWCRRRCLCGFASCTVVVLLVASIPCAGAEQQPTRIQLEDYSTIVQVTDPQISPDGKSIVCVVGHANLKEDRIDSSLVLIDIASGRQHTLTQERRKVGSPRWSPSGDRIAFLAQAPAPPATGSEEKPPQPKEQVYVMWMSGGDAQKVTDSLQDVEQFAWSPDGKQLAYVAADEPPNKKAIEQHNDAFEVGDNDYLATAAAVPSHIWLVHAEGGAARRLTSGTWSLPKSAPPSPPASPLSWSPDGKSIAFAQQATPYLGQFDQVVIATVDVVSGDLHNLTTHKTFTRFPLHSPDGSQLAYAYPRDGDPNNEREIFVAPATGGDGVDLTRSMDRNLARAIWMPDGKALLVGGHDGTRVSLWLQPLDGKARKLDLGDIDPDWLFWIEMAVGQDGTVAFVGSAPKQPSEVYYMASPSSVPRRLTDFNHTVASRALGRVEAIQWQGPDGLQEDGVVVYPPGFTQEKKYPLVLLIHGGPRASSTLAFNFLPQFLAAHDYVIFEPNYRGSDNLGNAYQRAIFNDAGDGPGRDVMAGLEVLEKRGFIDTSKIAVSGWSYGGYMTSWMIGHYQIWKAAVSGAAVNDLVHEYSLSDANVIDRYSFGGSPWTGDYMKAYREQSPMTYAAQIKTPTLILSDTGDVRVPITQSYLMYHALKDNGVPVKFIAYPVPGHHPADPVRNMDIYRRWAEWLGQYLK